MPGIGAQGCGMFLLPFLVGTVFAVLLDSTEVLDTSDSMLVFTALFLFPILLAQTIGVFVKSLKEAIYWRKRNALSALRLLDIVYRHLRVITFRGWILLASGLFLVVLAIGAEWAQFGMMATLGLFLFYGVTGWTIFASTFMVGKLDSNPGKGRGVTRQMVPTVVQSGDAVEEVFTFQKIPVPWGFVLLVEDPLPYRLRTESRYVVGTEARDVAECRGLLRATPRGHYFLGPAKLWYQDILGITMVSVASSATAELKVLPHFRSVQIVDPPKTAQTTPDILTKPHRFPTEEYFRFREYAHGDDTRRIQWKLSLRSGQLQVRQPETREIPTLDVLLVLDTWMPRGRMLDASLGADDILDSLVEAWLAIARELIERGDRVTLLAAVAGHEREDISVEVLKCVRGETARWQDLGARARWQGDHEVTQLLAHMAHNSHGMVVTGRFTSAPPGALPGQSMTWLYLDPATALGPPDAPFLTQLTNGPGLWRAVRWLVQLPHPVGAEENSALHRMKDTWELWHLHHSRAHLRKVAAARAGVTVTELCARGDAVYRIDRQHTTIRVVGIQAAREAP